MNLLEITTVHSNARRDANVGVDSVDDVILAMLGSRPVFDVTFADHARLMADLALESEVRTRADEVERLERDLAQHPGLRGLNVMLFLLYMTEAFACVNLIRDLGVDGEVQRVLIGGMLAAFIFWITSVAAAAQGAARPLVWVVYLALVIAVAMTRLQAETGGGEGGWAAALVLMAATVGPAWLAERLMVLRAPVSGLTRQLANARAALRDVRRRHDAARRQVEAIHSSQRAWDAQAAALRSTYTKEHRRRSAMAPAGGTASMGTPV